MEAPEQTHARLPPPCRTSSACRATSIARPSRTLVGLAARRRFRRRHGRVIRARAVGLVLRRNRQAALARLPHPVDSEGGPRQVVLHPRLCRLAGPLPAPRAKTTRSCNSRPPRLGTLEPEPEAMRRSRSGSCSIYRSFDWVGPHQTGDVLARSSLCLGAGQMHSTPPLTTTTRRTARRPAVSVIMPAFNVEPFIGGAIRLGALANVHELGAARCRRWFHRWNRGGG